MTACKRCGEGFAPGDRTRTMGNARYHLECAFRVVVGSVGHILRRCPCYGGTEDDPPGMTKRQAAQAAFELRWRADLFGRPEGRA